MPSFGLHLVYTLIILSELVIQIRFPFSASVLRFFSPGNIVGPAHLVFSPTLVLSPPGGGLKITPQKVGSFPRAFCLLKICPFPPERSVFLNDDHLRLSTLPSSFSTICSLFLPPHPLIHECGRSTGLPPLFGTDGDVAGIFSPPRIVPAHAPHLHRCKNRSFSSSSLYSTSHTLPFSPQVIHQPCVSGLFPIFSRYFFTQRGSLFPRLRCQTLCFVLGAADLPARRWFPGLGCVSFPRCCSRLRHPREHLAHSLFFAQWRRL